MNLCSETHQEVCFEGRDCPACLVITELQTIIDDLKKQNETLSEKIEDIESRMP